MIPIPSGVKVAEYSRDCLRDLRASTRIEYDER